MPKRYHTFLNPLFLSLIALVSLPSFAKKETTLRKKARAEKERSIPPAGSSNLDTYLVETLSVDPRSLSEYNLTRDLFEKTERALKTQSGYRLLEPITIEQGQLLKTKFSDTSWDTIREFTESLGLKSYNNAMLLGPAGVGKTFTVEQLVAMYSFGVVPRDIAALTGLDDVSNSKFKHQFHEAFVGKTQFYNISTKLLSLDNSGRKAMAKAEVRMKSIIHDLYEQAKLDFRENGVRTVFVIEEAGQMPPEVFQSLKNIADKAGFKDPENRFDAGSETGVSFIGITTPEEYRQMVKGDSAIQRRFRNIFLREPSEKKAFGILRDMSKDYERRFGIKIPDIVIDYVISMRKFFDNPPEAMPGGIIKAMDGLFNWTAIRKQRPDPHAPEITLDDAYAFLIERAQLPKDIWMPSGPNRVPLQDLENRVRTHMVGEAIVGEDGIIDHVVRNLKIGRINGFQEMPVYFIMGPSGSGKDTLARAINTEMFGHDGSNLSFDMAGSTGEHFTQIIEGTPNSDDPPELVKRLGAGTSPNGVIVFNEGKDLPSHLYDKLKILTETGTIHPIGTDSRARQLGFNAIFVMGQWGEELFDGLSDEEAMKKWHEISSDEKALTKILMEGQNGRKEGAVPFALIQRALKTGGLVLLPPVMKKDYIHIVRKHIETIQKRLKNASNLKIEVDKSVEDAILKIAETQGSGTRGLQAITKTLTEAMVSRAVDKGFPTKNATFRLVLDPDGVKVTLVEDPKKSIVLSARSLKSLSCEDILKSALKPQA